MTKRSKFHVVPSDKGWKVTKDGKTVSEHRKKEPAVERGRDEAKDSGKSQLIIHKQDGTIQTEHTYGDDPFPPKG